MLLAASLAANAYLYPRASRPLYSERDRPLIERTIKLASPVQRTSPREIRANTFPIVFSRGNVTCVELRDTGGKGHYGACYDRSGKLVEETASVSH